MTLAALAGKQVAGNVEDRPLDAARRMEAFLREVEPRAYRITLITVRDEQDALDIVQEAMIRLVKAYANRSAEEWRPLFYRILRNRTRDWQRRRTVRRRVFSLFSQNESTGQDVIAEAPASPAENPLRQLERADAMKALEAGLQELPPRQREAFMLRNLEGLNVKETARAMGCSQGSVKTHYSRAVTRLREALGDHRA
jgi:RNA polymerase sigma-70 factor (ECF subfamily)